MKATASRTSARLAGTIGKEISTRRYGPGDFLPSERDLAAHYKLSTRTVRRALKLLETDAVIRAEDRRGYRVLSKANDPDKGFPVAFVVSKDIRKDTDSFYRRILSELQTAAGRRGWSLLGTLQDGRNPDDIIEHLKVARCWGVVVDSVNPRLLDQVRQMGIPAILADAWQEDLAFDAVAQDGFSGAMQGASWLADRGHERIAFLGHPNSGASPQEIERFSGANGGLARHGIALPQDHSIEVRAGDLDKALTEVRKLLSLPDRPTGILAAWQSLSEATVQVANEMGLEFGRDLEMVGWSTEEDYENEYVPVFRGAQVQAAVVWSIRDLAEACILRLAERRANPHMPTTLTRIPMRLKMADHS